MPPHTMLIAAMVFAKRKSLKCIVGKSAGAETLFKIKAPRRFQRVNGFELIIGASVGRQVMAETSIEWTDATWNPVAGCSVITAGCTNCYAMRMAARLDAMGIAKYKNLTRKSGNRHVWTGRIRLDSSALAVPLSWKKPRKIFVNSMSDLFHEAVPANFVARVWSVMQKTPHHTYQILTKRPDRMRSIIVREQLPTLTNVWLGTSVEDSKVLARLDELRKTPAKI